MVRRCGWFDYNNDGRSTCLSNYLNYSIKTAVPCVQQGLPLVRRSIFWERRTFFIATTATAPLPTSLNSPTFQIRGQGDGLASPITTTMDSRHLRVERHLENYLLCNNWDGTHQCRAVRGVAYNAFGNAIAGMGADFRDIDNDGKPIFSKLRCSGRASSLQNLGMASFRAVATAGLEHPDQPPTAWEWVLISTTTGTRICSPPT